MITEWELEEFINDMIDRRWENDKGRSTGEAESNRTG